MRTGEQFSARSARASMVDGSIRIEDMRPLSDGRYKDGEWRFHRNSADKQ